MMFFQPYPVVILLAGLWLGPGEGAVLGVQEPQPEQPAQSGPAQGPSGREGLQALDDQIKKLDKEIIELSIQATQIGSADPWPPQDLAGSAQELAAAVQAAPAVSAAELLEGLDRVAVRVSRSTTLVPVLRDDRGWLEVIVPTLYEHGLTADPSADVEMRYLVQLGGGVVTTSRGGQKVGQYGAYSLRTDVSLALPARVQRPDGWYMADVEIGHITAITALPEIPSAEYLRQHLNAVTEQVLAKIRANTYRPQGENPWGPGEDDPATIEAWAESLRASFCDRRSALNAGLHSLGGFTMVNAKPTHPGGISELKDILELGALNVRWGHFLREAGLVFGLRANPALQHDWILSRYPQEGPLQGAIACASRTAVIDRDCLAMWNGRYVRYAGPSWVDRSQTKMALAGNVAEPLWQNLNQTMRNVIRQVLTGRSGELLDPHPDTPAIVAALERVQRADLPPIVTVQLASRIGRILDGESAITPAYRNRWIQQVDGKPIYNLAAIGDARRAELVPSHVQQALRRALDRVQYEDPIALLAFDRPFSHNREGNYVRLPEDFLQRFQHPRPSGGGALYSERVVDGWTAVSQLADYYAKNAKLAKASLSGVKDMLREHEVLLATYHDPKDGPSAAGSLYFFWYRQAPENWKQLLPKLPQGQGLHRMGPPCHLAPDYLREADSLLQRYQEDLAR